MSGILERLLPAAVLAALPVVGLVAGPAYAPLVFTAGAVQFLCRGLRERRLPRLDTGWFLVAALFASACWASAAWSILPDRSLRGALQVSAVFAGALLFLATSELPERVTRRLIRAMAIASLLGGMLLAGDAALGYPLETRLTHGALNAATKYNRGIAYALLLGWPVLAQLWRERAWRHLAALLLGLGLMLGAGQSLTAQVAAAASLAVLVAASFAPRLIPRLLTAATALFALLAPVLLRLAATYREALAPHLKQSGAVRLEIWDYMTARVLERPALGWGFWSAPALPIRPAELRGYAWVGGPGIYPHDQWLQLWVELGALGAAIGLAGVLLALRRVGGLPPALRPFGYAAFAAAATMSLANFDLATDSWWAAIAACAWLFKNASGYARPESLRPSSSAAKE